jgi:hypothetical protein
MNFHALYNAVTYVSIISVLVPLGSCIIRFKALNRELRALFFYIIISVMTDVISVILSKNYIQNIGVQNVFTILECTCISYIYLLRFETVKSKNIIKIFYISFLAMALFIFFFREGYQKSNSLISTLEACFIITLSTAYFYKLMKELAIYKLNDYYFFWINSAFLIYFSMSFFMFLFDSYLERFDLAIFYFIYSFQLITNIAFNIILATGVWKIRYK